LAQRHETPFDVHSAASGGDRGAAASPAVVTVLTTEHFTLQGARAATTSESTARAALFVGAAATLASLHVLARLQNRMHVSARDTEQALFPSPDSTPQTNGRAAGP
jgi:protein-tyrosine-phosphatase